MKLDTKAIRARAEAATPGPWEPYLIEFKDDDPSPSVCAPHSGWVDVTDSEMDCAFIAAAREDVPALCSRVEQLERALRVIADNALHETDCDLASAAMSGVEGICTCVLAPALAALGGER